MSRLLMNYIRRRLSCALLLTGTAAVFAVMLYLYRMPLEGALYGALLCAMGGAVFFAVGFTRYCRRYRTLLCRMSEPELNIEALPEPRDDVEEAYQQLLERETMRRRAEKADHEYREREQSEYYTLWAHQIKTPLAAMNLLLQGDAGRQTEQLRAELLKTEQYADMVMAYVRATADSTDFVLARHQLGDLVRQSVRRFAALFILKDIRLEMGSLSAEVLTDEKWLCFALEQIIGNALKYTPEGGCITISADGQKLTVADTGCGIAPEDLPRVFEKGYTGKNGRADKRASGIGLYLTRKILGRLGHGVAISSHPGGGTRVTIDMTAAGVKPI